MPNPPAMKAATATIDVSRLGPRRGLRARPKGRPVDPTALAEVRAALADAPRRRDLLIEHLHRINDTYGCLRAEHLSRLPTS
jgi:formate dehydrogenase